MAIQRLTAAQIETEVLRISGYSASVDAPWGTTANLMVLMNAYGQRLPRRLSQLAQKLLAVAGTIRFDMWRTPDTALTASSGGQTVYLPADYDHWISFYDSTNKRRIDPVEDVDKYHIRKLRDKAPGPPEAIELLDFVDASGTWRRRAKLYPATPAGVTPSISLTYWRLPAAMDDPTDSPDCDPKYVDLWLYGTVLEVARATDPHYADYLALESELMTEAVLTAKAAR